MTLTDYETRIKKAASIERLSDLNRMIETDRRLSSAERTKLQSAIDDRVRYFATISRVG